MDIKISCEVNNTVIYFTIITIIKFLYIIFVVSNRTDKLLTADEGHSR
jgi:hypothetical protein